MPAIRRHLRHAIIPTEDFYRGRISAALDAAVLAPRAAEPAEGGGAPVAARRLLELISAG
jgi:hypothetical protein